MAESKSRALTLEAAEDAIHKNLEGVLAKPAVQVTATDPQRSIGGAESGVYWRDVAPPTTAKYTIKPGDLLFINAVGNDTGPTRPRRLSGRACRNRCTGPAYDRPRSKG